MWDKVEGQASVHEVSLNLRIVVQVRSLFGTWSWRLELLE